MRTSSSRMKRAALLACTALLLVAARREREPEYRPTPPPLSLLPSSDVAMGGNHAFQGRGQTAQANSLTGEITVTVEEVLPNGTMRVRGEKQLRINRGNEAIRVSGIVRQGDLTADNR